VNASDFEPGDVILTTSGSIAVIIKVDEVAFPGRPLSIFKRDVQGAKRRITTDKVVDVIGFANVEKLVKLADELVIKGFDKEEDDSSEGKSKYTWYEANKPVPLKNGDSIKMRHGSCIKTVTFIRYIPRRYKYPIVYGYNGKRWKGAVVNFEGLVSRTGFA